MNRSTHKIKIKADKDDFIITSKATENKNRKIKEEIAELKLRIDELIKGNSGYEGDAKL